MVPGEVGAFWEVLAHSSPSVFSLVARCHGPGRPIPEVHRQAGLEPQLRVLGHLRALVQGQRPAQLLRQRGACLGHRIPHGLGTVPGQGWTVLHSGPWSVIGGR